MMHVYVNERVSKRIVRLQHGVAMFKHILGILVDLYSAILHISLSLSLSLSLSASQDIHAQPGLQSVMCVN